MIKGLKLMEYWERLFYKELDEKIHSIYVQLEPGSD